MIDIEAARQSGQKDSEMVRNPKPPTGEKEKYVQPGRSAFVRLTDAEYEAVDDWRRQQPEIFEPGGFSIPAAIKALCLAQLDLINRRKR